MKSNKLKILLGIGGIVGLVIIYFVFSSPSYGLVSLSFSELEKKIENKESFVLCLSQSTCSHCADYKPKLEGIASKYGFDIYYTDIDLYSSSEYDTFQNLLHFRDDDGTPMTLFLIDGKEDSIMSRLTGDVSELTVIKKLEKYGFISKE